MPRIGLSITKSTPFRNSVQEFSNVYYFEVISEPTVSEANALIDSLTAKEKTFHSSSVTFVMGRCWHQRGSAASNEMVSQKALSGTGATATSTTLDKERAWLFRLRAGVDSRGNPVYLRKYYHACGLFVTGQVIPNDVQMNTNAWSAGERAAQVSAMNTIGDAAGGPLTPRLCSKNGRLPDAGATWSAHAFLEHRQLGDMWRGT